MKPIKLMIVALLVCFSASMVSAQTAQPAKERKHAKKEHRAKAHPKAAKKLKKAKHKK